MTAPAFALQALLLVVPLIIAVRLSFTDWTGLSTHFDSVGAKNYRKLLEDPTVREAAQVTALIAIIGTVVCNGAGLFFALLLQKATRINKLVRAAIFYPQVLAPLVIGFVWAAFLGPGGVVSNVMQSAHMSPLPFLSDQHWAVGTTIFVIVWSTFGVNVVLYLAGLQTVPPDLLEAARIDGAGPVQTFRHVVLPMLAPIVTLNVVLVLVSLLRTYDLVVSLTGGGPAGSTQTVAYLILNVAFRNNELGYGAAQAVVLAAVTGVLAVLIILVRRRAEARVEA
jgi:ABC-type sugar transport systems, permease components